MSAEPSVPPPAKSRTRRDKSKAETGAGGADFRLDLPPGATKPWTADEIKQLAESHLVLPFASADQKVRDHHDAARTSVDGRHKALTTAARRNERHVRAVLGLPADGPISVERRTIGARWRDRRGAFRTGYGVICGAVQVWLGGTIREAEKALQVGVAR